MPDFEARIKTKFGELVLHFNDKGELEKRLEGTAELVRTIEAKTSIFAVVEERAALGLEGICTITPEGLPRIVVYPESDSDKVRLALFASPRPLTSEEITKVTGVRNPTALRFMKFDQVIKSGGGYTLSGTGRTYFTSKELPKLKEKLQATPKAQ